VRVVRGLDGSVAIDPTGKRSGRGAYVCDAADCWQVVLKRGTLVRALKIETISDADLQTLNAHAERLSGTPESAATSPRND
jgi:uncharacterized protein